MACNPILFNTEMVQAIQAGRKTQTRRIAFAADDLRKFACASYPNGWWYKGRVYKSFDAFIRDCQTPKCRYKPGDILWVRETWGKLMECNVYPPYEPEEERFIYRADIGDPDHFQAKWHPSIHMPKEAARIFLRVKDVRVERLLDIDNADAIAEGFSGTPCHHENADPVLGCTDCLNTGWLEPPFAEFAQLWDTTIKPADRDRYGWIANPWVWVIEFEYCEKPKGWPDA